MKLGLILWSCLLVCTACKPDAVPSRPDAAVPRPVSPADLPNHGSDPPRQQIHASVVTTGVPGPSVDPLVIATGTSGTYTVPYGYVTGVSAIAGGSGGTLTITPNGPTIVDAQAQPTITIPAGWAWTLPRPVIAGASYEMGAGTVFVFTGTLSYTVVISQGGT